MPASSKINDSDPLRVVVVGQTPPPVHGQGVMLERLVNSRMQNVSMRHVRMAFSQSLDDVSRFQFRKLLHLVSVVFRIVVARIAHRAEVLYYPPAGPNRVPMYRDLVILLSTRWMFRKTIFHFQAGGISQLHGRLSSGLVKRLFELAYYNADGAVRLSELTPEDAVGLKAKREFIVPNCSEDERSRFASKITNGQADSKPIRIVYLGTVCVTKGILVLLEACRLMRERGISFELEVVGGFQPADFENEVVATIEQKGLTDSVILAGQQTGDAKFERLAAADVFCFPTHYESEAFPCVVVEAMSFGLPVVSTQWRGVPSIVEHESTGFLAPPHDAEAIADYLIRLAQDGSLRAAMGKAGRTRFESEFTTERHLELMEDVFLSVGRPS